MKVTEARPLLFYSAWPLGYHNVEAERKAVALADDGHDVVYVAGIGIRNPRTTSARKLLHRVRAKWGAASAPATGTPSTLRTGALAVVPPRQLAPLRALNARWVTRQLEGMIEEWPRAIAWVRYPTPELVEALRDLRPALVIYECFDAYLHTPGITGRWRTRFERAERALVQQAASVVVPGEALAERFRAMGAAVHVVPHGVDLFPWRPREAKSDGAFTVGYVGTLDYRLDMPVLREIASARPAWRVRLAGVVQEGFDPDALAHLPNVTIEPPIPHERLGETLREFDAGLMPYADLPLYRYQVSVKNLEFMAAGTPAVARPNEALAPFAGLVRFAETPAAFVEQLDAVRAEGSPELARRLRTVSEEHSWGRRMEDIRSIIQAELPD